MVKSFWKHAPLGPGVYRMIGADGEVLYVGKARSIKKRVQAYTTPERQSIRIARMVAQTVSMVFVTTETEAEALLLEANFIKQLKPRYNVLLRDDKSFPYILIAGGHDAPRLMKHRGARSIRGDYFGPFASAGAVTRTLNALQRAFLLRTCSDSYYDNRTRPCLLYQIKRCSAPCTGEIAPADYAELVDAGARLPLRPQPRDPPAAGARDERCGRDARFREGGAVARPHLGAVGDPGRAERQSALGAGGRRLRHRRGGGPVLHRGVLLPHLSELGQPRLFPARRPRARARRRCSIRSSPSSTSNGRRRGWCCSATTSPRAHRCARSSARAPAIASPSARRARGEKKELVDNALRNAREALSRKLAEAASQAKLLAALAAAFGLAAAPRRIEVYDNSHIMGTNAIGAMIVAGPEGFVKNQYRTFNIKSATLTPGDDYAMMREVLTPPLRAAAREQAAETGDAARTEGAFPDRPDLVVVDGGRGQLEAARQVFAELGVEGVALASIAKGPDRNAGRETFFIAGREPFKLSPRDPALFFVQRLRDEAHRFAIGTHRARRKKDFVKSPLDEIPGIGPARKRALLHAFGSAKDVANAGLADLEKTPGLNAATAKRIYDFFHEGGGR